MAKSYYLVIRGRAYVFDEYVHGGYTVEDIRKFCPEPDLVDWMVCYAENEAEA